MPRAQRSTSGCWTCRLRRKKCDETRPGCERCRKLNFPCDGYGERPAWMDGGVQERLRATNTQQIIKNLGSKRPLVSRRSTTASILRHQSPSLTDTDSLSDITGWPPLDLNLADINFMDELTVNADATCRQSASHESEPDRLEFSASQEEINPFSFNIEDMNSIMVPLDWNSDDHTSSSGACSQCPSNRLSRGYLSTTNDRSLEEADLLVSYFNNIERMQFPFPEKGNRGWQYMLISRSEVCCLATLSLSCHDQGRGTVRHHSYLKTHRKPQVTNEFAYRHLSILQRSSYRIARATPPYHVRLQARPERKARMLLCDSATDLSRGTYSM
jgi:hypothetical protein